MTGLAVDRADIDDAAEVPGQHPLPHSPAHIEAAAEVGIEHLVPSRARHLAHGGIARDPRVVDDDLDRPQFRGDGIDRGNTGFEIGDIPLLRHDAGFFRKGFGLGVVLRVVGDDRAAHILQPNRDRATDAAGSSGDDCHACRHFNLPSASNDQRSTQTAMPMPPPMHMVAIPFLAFRLPIS